MNLNTGQLRVAILSPVHLPDFKGAIPGLPVDDPSFPRGMGGYSVGNLVIARLKRGLPTDIITLDPSVREPILRWDGGLVRLWIVRRRLRRSLRDGFRHEEALLRQALLESKPDVCHAHWTYEYGLAAVRQHDVPVVLTVHDHAWNCLRLIGPRYAALFMITRYVLSRARHVAAVAPHVAAYVEKRGPLAVPVIPNVMPQMAWDAGAKADEPRATANSALGEPGTIRITSAVNWSRLKNTKRAIEAFRIMRRHCAARGTKVDYTLMGPGLESNGPADTWARTHGGAEGIEFAGSVRHEAALRLIGSSDILFHPSLEEAMPGPVAEAMMMLVPVVACREAPGSRWLLDEGKCGLLVPGKSPPAMAQAIETLIGNIGAAAAMCRLARERIHALCAPEPILSAYEKVYRAALEAGAQ